MSEAQIITVVANAMARVLHSILKIEGMLFGCNGCKVQVDVSREIDEVEALASELADALHKWRD